MSERSKTMRSLIDTAAAAGLLIVVACAGGDPGMRQPAMTPGTPSSAAAGAAGTTPIHVYVANESSDLVSELVFTPGGSLELVGDVRVGLMPADVDGAHGLKVAPGGDFWYVSLAHGTPYGKLWKFTTDTNEFAGETTLGMFPASMDLSPNGDMLFIVNFNLHGDPIPSTVSIVHTPTMTEVARPTTCVMPHGSRLDAAGRQHYSVCMHSEQLVAIDTRTLEVSRRISLVPGQEGSLALDDVGEMDAHADHAAHGGAAAAVCSPTWATPARGERANRFVYVACNRNSEVIEVDVVEARVSRRFPTGRSPYNLDITPDGRLLVASLKAEQAVAVFDLDEGREIARIPMSRNMTHGVAISRDGRWAFISNEAVGSTRSTVDVVDLERLDVVASAEVHYQAGGIDLSYEE